MFRPEENMSENDEFSLEKIDIVENGNKAEEELNYPRLPFAHENLWSYPCRRQMQEILSNVFLGPYASAAKNKLESLKAARITHIICIRHQMEINIIKPNFPTEFKYHVLQMEDTFHQNIISLLPDTRAFIDEAIQSQGNVLIHGNAGISRSASIVIGYVMEKFGVPYKKAFQFVQSKRFCINPSAHFENQLTEYEPIFRARHQSRLQAKSTDSGMEATDFSSKRKHDDTDFDVNENSR